MFFRRSPQLPQSIVVILEQFRVDASQGKALSSADPAILYVPVPGGIAVDLWTALRANVDDTGMWPVLLGDDRSLERHQDEEQRKRHIAVDGIIAASYTTDVATWHKEMSEQLRAWLQSTGKPEDYLEDDEVDTVHGDWPDDMPPNDTFTIPYNWRTHAPLPVVYLGFVPTRTSWQVPAFLRWGDWNSTPSPAVHASQLRAWEEQYGAEVVGITHDIIEMQVARPPRTREAALLLATQQYAYCSDIVDQGVGTIEELAASLLDAPVWYFWWD